MNIYISQILTGIIPFGLMKIRIIWPQFTSSLEEEQRIQAKEQMF